MNIETIAYLGLGSNLATPTQQLHAARVTIFAIHGIEEIAFSSLYRSPPMGSQNQPDYVNAVMAIKTNLSALELLASMQNVENEHGRIRQERWRAALLWVSQF